MLLNWAKKYSPQNLHELLGRNREVQLLTDVFRETPNATVVVNGKGGVGCTTLVSVVLSKVLDFDIILYDSVTSKNDKVLDHIFNLNSNNILERLRGEGPVASRRTALVIDNLDTISLSSEKNVIDKIVLRNIKEKLFPLVLIINDNSYKIIDDIKGATKVIQLRPLEKGTMTEILDSVSKKENIHLECEVRTSIIDVVQSDIRCLLNLLQDLQLCFGETFITQELLSEFLENTQSKKIDRHLFDSYKLMLLKRGDIRDTQTIYNNDKVLLPLILQENYCKDIFNRKHTNRSDVARRISEYISQGDIIETYIYTDQNWHLQEMHCFVSCTLPMSILETGGSYTSEADIKYNVTFSTELNKTSLKNINRKNISIISSSTGVLPCDIQHVSSLMNELVRAEKYTRIGELSKDFSDDQMKFIETVIKVDKCNPTTVTFNNRSRKSMLPFLNQNISKDSEDGLLST